MTAVTCATPSCESAHYLLGRIGSPEARSALEVHLTTEDDLWVREELKLALMD